MAIPQALAAINTLLKIGSQGCPQTFYTVANVGDEAMSVSGAVVDVTSHSTGDPWRRKIVTLLDGGDLTFPLFFIPDSTGIQGDGTFGHGGTSGLLNVFTLRELRRWALVFPDAGATTWYFDGCITKFNIGAAVAGVETASVTITVTGMPVFE